MEFTRNMTPENSRTDMMLDQIDIILTPEAYCGICFKKMDAKEQEISKCSRCQK